MFGKFDRLTPFDLGRFDRTLLCNAVALERPFTFNAGTPHLLARGDLCAFGGLLLLRALAGKLGSLRGTGEFNLLLLPKLGIFRIAVDLER